jgi:type VI secretion system protein ImpI/type VI secretion system protein
LWSSLFRADDFPRHVNYVTPVRDGRAYSAGLPHREQAANRMLQFSDLPHVASSFVGGRARPRLASTVLGCISDDFVRYSDRGRAPGDFFGSMRELPPMALTLTMLRCPDAVPPQTRKVPGGEFSIGRGADNDWALPDSDHHLSRRHCVLAFRAGGWQIADLSANGTFLNRDTQPIGRAEPRDLRDGDRLRFGPYEIEVRLAEAVQQRGRSPRDEPAASDPFAPPAAPFERDPLLRPARDADPFAVGLAPPSINLPADYDPLTPEPAEIPFPRPTQSDHSPHLEDAFIPPAARAVLPEDWDRDPDPHPAAAPTPPPIAPPAAAAAPLLIAAAPPPAAELPAMAKAAAGEIASGEDLVAAFLRGAGLRDFRPADPAAAMERLGAAFRAFVSGLRQAMIARAAVKSELRIETTQIRSRGNNPLKFSADDDDALAVLLGAGRRTEMSAFDAVSEALRDLRLHELATFAAMQSAVRSLLVEFDPAKLRLAAERGALDLVPLQKKARAWDRFEALHAKVREALCDDFDSVFGKAFARAYEKALAEASAKEPVI